MFRRAATLEKNELTASHRLPKRHLQCRSPHGFFFRAYRDQLKDATQKRGAFHYAPEQHVEARLAIMEALFVGTSGWVYKGWAGSFYPEGVPVREHLAFYASQFNTVEINASFYRLPSEATVRGWHKRAPRGFIYAVKGSRFITHMKKLNVERKSIDIFFERAALLKQRLGPILWQLPPNLHYNPQRLDGFLSMLPEEYRYAVEFRHPSWVRDESFVMLRKHNVAHVNLSSMSMPGDLTITADFLYIRFHGLEGGFAHDYTREELEPWARHCRAALDHGHDVFAYFNNDANTRAPGNAMALRELIERPRRPRPSRQRRERAVA
jgi:uncharacterized protein YecE (DUF72 family)